MASLLYHISDDVQVFRKTQAERRLYRCVGVPLFVLSPFIFLLIIHSKLLNRPFGTNTFLPIFFIVTLSMMFAGAYLVYRSGPQELSIDIKRQTYQVTHGWLSWHQTQSGSWKDIWGVYVGVSQNGGYIVGIARWGQNDYTAIERLYKRSVAEQFANELASATSVPRVIPPRYLRPYR